jgi:hypothetical protein
VYSMPAAAARLNLTRLEDAWEFAHAAAAVVPAGADHPGVVRSASIRLISSLGEIAVRSGRAM